MILLELTLYSWLSAILDSEQIYIYFMLKALIRVAGISQLASFVERAIYETENKTWVC